MEANMITAIQAKKYFRTVDSIGNNEEIFMHIKRHYGKIMYRFVLQQVVDRDLADELFAKALHHLSLKKDLRKVLIVIEPWLAVFFHNFCQRELERSGTRSEVQSVA